jgi:transcription antitermination factor NusG
MASAEPILMQSPARWYAAYTAPRHEKSVQHHLESRGVEHFLPLYKSVRLWNGRRAVVQMPLFPGYLFVRLPVEHRMQVLEVPGVLNIVSSHGRLVPLAEGEVETLRATLEVRRSEPCLPLSRGKKVRIKRGPLCGLEGVIVKEARQLRMVVSVECIKQAFAVELDASDLEIAATSAQRMMA